MSYNNLVLLANVIMIVHALMYIILPTLGIYLAQQKNKNFLAYWSGIILAGTFPSQWFFRNDCPLRIFEYCFRYFGGEKVIPDRFHTVAYMIAKGTPEAQIYSQLLRQTGIFLLIGFAFVTTLAFFLNKHKMGGENYGN